MSNNPYFQHHFVDSEQQYEASKMGMWAFLVTEVLTFAGLFCAYAIFRAWNPGMFISAHEALDVTMGATNTVVLITSSLTMALAIRNIQLNNNRGAIINLVLTLIFAGMFLVIKYFEYTSKFDAGHYPWTHNFYAVYFTMTGLHGLHIIGGIIVNAYFWLPVGNKMWNTEPERFTNRIEVAGLYWHFVDLVWIFLFPSIYLL